MHGFAEHSGRHSDLAEFLAGIGFEVWAGDPKIYLVNNTSFGNIGVDLEMKLFEDEITMPGTE